MATSLPIASWSASRLDDAGLHDVKVLVSGDIDEFRIAEILGAGAPVDGFGVGGNLGVGLGTVASGTVGGVIGAVYKLVWFDSDSEHPSRIKIAGGKSTWPGRKQVYRIGTFERDLIALEARDCSRRRARRCFDRSSSAANA